MTPEQIDRFAAHGWITGRGDGSSERHHPRLTKKDRALYEQAKANRYLTGGTFFDLRELWFLYCEARQWPFVVLRPRCKSASIIVDFIAVTDFHKAEGISETVWQLVQSHADELLKKKTIFSGGDVMFTIRGIPSGFAPQLAKEIAERCFACLAA